MGHCWEISVNCVISIVGGLVSLQSCALASYVVISVPETKETFKGDFTLDKKYLDKKNCTQTKNIWMKSTRHRTKSTSFYKKSFLIVCNLSVYFTYIYHFIFIFSCFIL